MGCRLCRYQRRHQHQHQERHPCQHAAQRPVPCVNCPAPMTGGTHTGRRASPLQAWRGSMGGWCPTPRHHAHAQCSRRPLRGRGGCSCGDWCWTTQTVGGPWNGWSRGGRGLGRLPVAARLARRLNRQRCSCWTRNCRRSRHSPHWVGDLSAPIAPHTRTHTHTHTHMRSRHDAYRAGCEQAPYLRWLALRHRLAAGHRICATSHGQTLRRGRANMSASWPDQAATP